jgi:hypothetical protein
MRPIINFQSSRGNAEVIALPFRIKPDPFEQLTANLVIAQYRAGTLPEGVLVALLASAGLQP